MLDGLEEAMNNIPLTFARVNDSYQTPTFGQDSESNPFKKHEFTTQDMYTGLKEYIKRVNARDNKENDVTEQTVSVEPEQTESEEPKQTYDLNWLKEELNKKDSIETSLTQPTATSQSVARNTKKYTPNEFYKEYIAAGRRLGFSDNYIFNLLAKDSLESARGTKYQSPYNFGNITAQKGYSGKVYEGKDHDKNGKKISQRFRAYDSIEEYLKDCDRLLKHHYWVTEDDNINTFLYKLQGGNPSKSKYAQHENYSKLVKTVWEDLKKKNII